MRRYGLFEDLNDDFHTFIYPAVSIVTYSLALSKTSVG